MLDRIKTKDYRSLPLRKITSAKFGLPVKRRHCYRVGMALDVNAKIPANTSTLRTNNLRHGTAIFVVHPVFGRSSSSMQSFGCAPTFGTKEIKIRAYNKPIASNKTEVDISQFEGVNLAFEERPMKADEAERYFCPQCRRAARSCGRLATCKRLRSCLQDRGMTLTQCRDFY